MLSSRQSEGLLSCAPNKTKGERNLKWNKSFINRLRKDHTSGMCKKERELSRERRGRKKSWTGRCQISKKTLVSSREKGIEDEKEIENEGGKRSKRTHDEWSSIQERSPCNPTGPRIEKKGHDHN